jgi:repressor LexA
MSEMLTPTEEKVFAYLIEFLAANSYQPSIREIGRQFEIKSTKTVSDILGSLARKGFIQRNQARSRGLRILGSQGSGTRAIPFFSTLSQRTASGAADPQGDTIVLDRRLVPGANAFFVRVMDDAMSPCGIRREDTVLVNPDFAAMDGDFVAVRIGHEVAVRALQHVAGVRTLTAIADDVAPMTLGAADGDLVLGVVSGVFRGVLQADVERPDTVAAA